MPRRHGIRVARFPSFSEADGCASRVCSTVERGRHRRAPIFGGAKEQYNKRGITDTRAEIVRLHWATNRIAIVEVKWPYLDARGATRGHETSTYTLRRADTGDLKLRVAVMHGATDA